MKFIYALLGIVLFFILSFLAEKLNFYITGCFYSIEHASGTFSYIYAIILTFSPFLGAVIGWKFANSKRNTYLLYFPFYFLFMFIFYWYSALYAGYPFFK